MASETPRDPLDSGAIQAIIAGRHGAPFDILGPHSLDGTGNEGQAGWVVRALAPGAHHVWLCADNAEGMGGAGVTREQPASENLMRQLSAGGLFSITGWGARPAGYTLRVEWASGAVDILHDPFAFEPQLSDEDLRLMNEGAHPRLYEQLGAHLREVDGVSGARFAVWAPNARRVSVVGDFNTWNAQQHPMRLRAGGIWEIFVPGVAQGANYKYAILSWNGDAESLKADPFASYAEYRPDTASRVWNLEGYAWGDQNWADNRARGNGLDAPMTIYEVQLGSWAPDTGSEGWRINYRTVAHQLAPYLLEMGFTHVELMPLTEYPYDGSWGYQVTGYFAPTSRYGSPQDFMYFVDYLHQQGIGVIMDWVPAHFPKDAHGLAYFDGSHLYEHADPRQGEQPDWGTLVFNYGRAEVRDFLVASALFWLDMYHIDGLRVDAVASMLYLDYSRKDGEWIPNRFGGRENLEAIAFLQQCNTRVTERFPHRLMIAEESTAWTGVTAPASEGGLGFTLKWNMGWMHDILEYFGRDSIHRKYHQHELTFSFVYAFAERFLLPFSHDEVVHMKGSMLNKMSGDTWQKFANLRALYTLMYGHPGKKLLFMGSEFGQWAEWNHDGFLDWGLLDSANPDVANHGQLRALVRDLNAAVHETPALHERDFTPEGFEWINGSDAQMSSLSFARWAGDGRDMAVVVGNYTPIPRDHYRVGVSRAGRYTVLVNSDAAQYGGAGYAQAAEYWTENRGADGKPHVLELTLPPLATIILRYQGGN